MMIGVCIGKVDFSFSFSYSYYTCTRVVQFLEEFLPVLYGYSCTYTGSLQSISGLGSSNGDEFLSTHTPPFLESGCD